MKVGNRLTLYCSIVFGVVFAVSSLLIYFLYYNNVERNIYKGLEKNAYISAFFYLEEDELDAKEFDKVRKQFKELVPATSYQLYNVNNELSFGAEALTVPPHVLDEIKSNASKSFELDDYLCYGMFYEDNQGDFVIITKENIEVLTDQMAPLSSILFIAFLVGLLAIVVLSRWIARVAYRPFSSVIRQVNNISANKLDVQIESPNTKDELQDLIETFNELLAEISETFVIQKNFVNYVSHEFKTPLASLLGNLEVFSIKDRSPEEYNQLTKKLITDIHQLEDILETLLAVSDLRTEKKLESKTRVDEIVWDLVAKVSKKYVDARVAVDIAIEAEDEDLMYVNMNRTQLFMALLNLVENSIKYSQNRTAVVTIYKKDSSLNISIVDTGIGIPKSQLKNISQPFYRANNTQSVQGFGIGLSIAFRILEKNNVIYIIDSEEGKGTSINLTF